MLMCLYDWVLKKRMQQTKQCISKFNFECIFMICVCKYANVVAYKWFDVAESKYKLFQFVCSAIFSEYITRRECKSVERPFKPTFHTIKQARHFLKCCTASISRRDVSSEVESTGILD